jgi:hypothetical protein
LFWFIVSSGSLCETIFFPPSVFEIGSSLFAVFAV